MSVPFGYMYAESQNPNPGRGSRQAGPLFEKDLRFPGRKVVKFVHEFVEDFVEDIVVHPRRQLVTASCIDAAVG